MAKKNILAESVKVEYANPQPCCCEATFTFAADAVKAEKSKVVAYIGGVARLPGFRAGKAPASLWLPSSPVKSKKSSATALWVPLLPRSKKTRILRS